MWYSRGTSNIVYLEIMVIEMITDKLKPSDLCKLAIYYVEVLCIGKKTRIRGWIHYHHNCQQVSIFGIAMISVVSQGGLPDTVQRARRSQEERENVTSVTQALPLWRTH